MYLDDPNLHVYLTLLYHFYSFGASEMNEKHLYSAFISLDVSKDC